LFLGEEKQRGEENLKKKGKPRWIAFDDYNCNIESMEPTN